MHVYDRAGYNASELHKGSIGKGGERKTKRRKLTSVVARSGYKAYGLFIRLHGSMSLRFTTGVWGDQ